MRIFFLPLLLMATYLYTLFSSLLSQFHVACVGDFLLTLLILGNLCFLFPWGFG